MEKSRAEWHWISGKIMCGIVAYFGKKTAQPILLEGLKRLEYRGYDSAGVAVFHEGELVALSANLAHHADVGGMVPGSQELVAEYTKIMEGVATS